eukprot:m.243031 g.243031  ORF g.243031 m.243031 type:complete len:123 (-) comp15338_c1_seq7:2663-3031(-)
MQTTNACLMIFLRLHNVYIAINCGEDMCRQPLSPLTCEVQVGLARRKLPLVDLCGVRMADSHRYLSGTFVCNVQQSIENQQREDTTLFISVSKQKNVVTQKLSAADACTRQRFTSQDRITYN